ncbi:MAG TPA: hypothetical protein PLE24_00500 [Chitinispirillaceae bacterium]|nr:hypothetical protein [Chitinispirillaceae bacterium]
MRYSALCLISMLWFAVSAQNQPDTVQKASETIANDSSGKPAVESTAEKNSGQTVETSSRSNKVPEIIESEEELILEGGEEDLLGPAREEKKIEQLESSEKVAESPDQSTDSSLAETEQSTTEQEQKVAEKPVKEAPESGLKPQPAPEVSKIEKMEPINFARNLKEYRSPKVAIMLSLLLPGLGQAYARNVKKAVAYGAVEATVIGVGAGFGIKGRNEKKDAYDFADQHYSTGNFLSYYKKLSSKFSDSTLEQIFLGTDSATFIRSANKKDEDFYRTIREYDNPFIHGWDDAEPGFDGDFEILSEYEDKYRKLSDLDKGFLVYKAEEDSGNALYGFSENQKKFSKKISESNKYYRISKGVLTMLLVNHIVSAIDAGITAKAHNDQLLGKESFWQRINIEQQTVQTVNGPASGYALQVRF